MVQFLFLFSMAAGCSPELGGKNLRLEGTAKIKLELAWKLPSCSLVVTVPKDATQVDGGGIVTKLLAQLWTLCVTKLTGHARSAHGCHSAKPVTGVINCSLIRFEAQSTSFILNPAKSLQLGRLSISG